MKGMQTRDNSMPPALVMALHCAVWPIIIASGIMGVAFFGGSFNAGLLGMALLWIAFPVNVIGLLLWAKCRVSLRNDPESLARWRSALHWAIFLLLLNYPVAVVYALVGSQWVMPTSAEQSSHGAVTTTTVAQIFVNGKERNT